MLKTFYHATPFENLCSIMNKGIHKGIDGVVYLTEKPEDAIKFLIIRGYKEILVCQVVLEEDLIQESFDHNEKFFKCRAYMYSDDIDPYDIEEFYKYAI